ncbi:MAG: Ni/Fe-hydrogenase, b-type cytochrome subunit, partial [Chloroflexi bacterium]|nr:Ni/Fe-hydrogenase, b-type cytochrome subunit [Chloroflexota bacterium]MBU1750197.1 Ni/Fe-hydrogenase, b-type cytochrome subunit [Chloroflexota bacterium]
SIMLLALTGLYIANPFLASNMGEAYHSYVMGTMRFIHAIAAVVFGVNALVRLYWLFVGNRYARWSGFLPLSQERLRNTVAQIKFYALISKETPFDLGHNSLAGLSYMALFVIMLLQGITGLALYAEYYPASLWGVLFDPVFSILGPNQNLRLIHHLLMWVFAAFTVVHLYMAVLYDLLEGDATFSSMINGFKIFPQNKHEK